MKFSNITKNAVIRAASYSTIAFALILSAMLAACSKDTIAETAQPQSSYTYWSENEGYSVDNSENEYGITASETGGIYSNKDYPQYITLSTDTGYTIRYTKTCDKPTSESDILESGDSIKLIYKGTKDGKSTDYAVVRCALFDGDTMIGQVQTYSFLTCVDGRFTTPVFMFIGDSDDLFGYENGIYVSGKLRDDAKKYGNPKGWSLGNTNANYYQTGRMSEREISIQFSESGSGDYDFISNGGVRINGGYTRCNTQKSLKFFSRKEYTPAYGTFAIDLFPGYRDSTTNYIMSFADSFLLRGGSNNEGNTVISTPFQLMMAEGTILNVPAMRPVTEFLNGEYKGVFMLTEDYDADYFEAHYGITEEDLLLITGCYENYGGSMYTLDVGTDEELEEFKSMMKAMGKLDMTVDENYQYFKDTIDEQSFIEYMCFEIYCCNSDWPDNNIKIWKYNGDNTEESGPYDGKWRLLLKDLDLAFGNGHAATTNPYTQIESVYSTFHLKEIFTKCMKNKTFSNKVYAFMMTLSSTIFAQDRVEDTLDKLVLTLGSEMQYTSSQLGVGGGSLTSWINNVNNLASFNKQRAKNVSLTTRNKANAEYCDITVKIEGDGKVDLGWFAAEDGMTAQYITKIRIPLQVSDGGKIFVDGGTYYYGDGGFVIIDSTEATIRVVFDNAAETEEKSHPVINEVAYRNCDNVFVELYNPTDSEISLNGYTLRGTESQDLSGYSIPAHGFFVLADAEICDNCAPLAVTLSKKTTLQLIYDNQTVDTLSLNTTNRTIHQGCYPDGGDVVQLYTYELTPGSANAICESSDMQSTMKNGLFLNGVFTSFKALGSDGITMKSEFFYNYFQERMNAYASEFKFFRDTKNDEITLSDLTEYLEEHTRFTARYNESANVYFIVLDK